MRILCIRGEHLASLYGPFELPLEGGPIAETGLFSISGPTGAGKSTLMDALCLALFGRTPRLGDRGRSVMIGRPDEDASLLVDANDERNILSRGAGEGHAEVDFEGVDGGRYRARWSVNRARGRANGKLQQPKMVLTDLAADQPVTSGLTAVPERIEKLVGYSFEEFKRAVMLPQFEFTAFLKAKPDERAAILERVTGTDVYTRLSIAAHQRAGTEDEKLRVVEERAGAVKLLTDEERREHVERVAALSLAQQEAKAAAKVASDAVRWHDSTEGLTRELAEASSGLSRATEERAAGEPLRVELQAVEGAQALRPLHDDAVRTTRERQDAAARVATAEGRLATAKGEHARVVEGEKLASASATDAAGRLEAARPELSRARELDVGIAEAKRRTDAANAALTLARADAEKATGALAQARRAITGCEALRDRAVGWLRDHADGRVLASEWPRWQATLRDHASILADLARSEASLAAARDAHRAAASRKTELERSTLKLEAGFSDLEEHSAAAAGAAANDDPKALKKRTDELADRRDALKELAAQADRAAHARAARDESAEAARTGSAALDAARREVDALELKITASEAALAASREALERIAAAFQLEDHRETLVEGEPCPLCGATAHPYAKKAPTESLHRKQAEAVTRAESELKGVRKAGADAAKRVAKVETGLETARKDEAHQADVLGKAQERYSKLRDGSGITGVPARAADAGEKLAAMLAAADTGLSAARKEQERAIGRKQAADAARKAVDEARRELEAARKALAAVEREVDRAAKDGEKYEEAVRSLAVRRDGVEAGLEPALGFRRDWRAPARNEPAAFFRECGEIARAHADREAERKNAEEQIASLRQALEGVSARAEEKQRQSDDTAAAAARETAALDSVRQLRAKVLGGASAEAVEKELRRAEQAAQSAVETSRRAVAEADRHLAAADQEQRGAAERVAAIGMAVAAADDALAAALTARAMDRTRLAALLGRDAKWIEGTRGALAALDKALHEATARVAERRRKLGEHDATGRPDVSKDEAAQRVASAETREREAAVALTEVQVRLREDERSRAEVAKLAGERDAQRAVAERWRRLAEVIGSSDGKRFRTFAQGLALDALLHHASHHLRCLAPRYGLMRVPGADLELQVVDHDLGDEVRSVNGLSGGETFLVSLALALGLASLSTRVTQARTLFIDEGFGTLDRDTLENAMVALESLRATGRTIGVISHVPELHERIGVRVTVERVSAGRSRVVLPVSEASGATASTARIAS
jgi:DNA repair protein SbcC/Rad50